MTAKKETNHAERKHALLSASGASRWLACTPSPRIEEKFPDKGSSPFAAEGTLAHEFGDIGIKLASGQMTKSKYKLEHTKFSYEKFYSEDMEVEVQKYIDYVMDQFKEAQRATKDAVLLVEEKVDLRHYIDEGFGTCDANIIGNEILEVIDLKFGKGLRVDADNNSQLKLYGLGALMKYDMVYDIKTVKLTIVQPRLNHLSTWEISVDDLIKWGENVVIPKAKIAYEGKGLQVAGDHCKWCKAKAKCSTMASKNMKVAQHDFKDPHLLTDAQLIDVYKQLPRIKDWIESVGKYIFETALEGKSWPGYKLVEGRSNRVWSDAEKVMEALENELYEKDKFTTSKLNGIGAVEKLVGKKNFQSILGDLIIKPQGKPTLVVESDKRLAMGMETANSEFGEDEDDLS